MTTGAETGVIQQPAKEHQGLQPPPAKRHGTDSTSVHLEFRFGTSWAVRERTSVVLSHPAWAILVWQPQETNIWSFSSSPTQQPGESFEPKFEHLPPVLKISQQPHFIPRKWPRLTLASTAPQALFPHFYPCSLYWEGKDRVPYKRRD